MWSLKRLSDHTSRSAPIGCFVFCSIQSWVPNEHSCWGSGCARRANPWKVDSWGVTVPQSAWELHSRKMVASRPIDLCNQCVHEVRFEQDFDLLPDLLLIKVNRIFSSWCFVTGVVRLEIPQVWGFTRPNNWKMAKLLDRRRVADARYCRRSSWLTDCIALRLDGESY